MVILLEVAVLFWIIIVIFYYVFPGKVTLITNVLFWNLSMEVKIDSKLDSFEGDEVNYLLIFY